jgi:hypothetical protein
MACFFLLRSADPAAGPGRETPPAKGLSNDDVVAMVHAHLSDGVIVTAIEQEPNRFITTAAALIALKSAGVDDAVLGALVKAGSRPPLGSPGSRSDAQPGVALLRDEGPLRLQKAPCASGIATGLRTLIPGFGKTLTSTFPGARARLRLPPTPSFEIRYPADAQLTGNLLLFRLKVAADRRSLDRPIDSALGRTPDLVPLVIGGIGGIGSIDDTGAGGALGRSLSRYEAQPQSPLPPGEYALLLGSGHDYYDFGVDP